MQTKTCPGCDSARPLDQFSKKRTTSDGLQVRCKDCAAAYARDWRAANLERKRQMDRDYAAANRVQAAEKAKRWRAENPERHAQNDRAYRHQNADRVQAYSDRYRTQNRDKIQARKEAYRVENRDRIRQQNKEWRQNNRAKVLADRTLRKMRKRRATPPWLTKAQRLEMRRAYETAQVFTDAMGEPYHVDHIVPINSPVVCGLHVPWNLQVLRGVENIEKGNRLD